FSFGQVFADDSPHRRARETVAKIFVEICSPDRIVAPGITAGHGKRTARWLEAPLGAANETARGIGLIKLERMNVLAPEAVRTLHIFIEKADDSAEGMHHQATAHQARRIGKTIREFCRVREQE